MLNRVPRLIQAAAIVAAAVVTSAAVTAIGKPAPLPALPSPIITVTINLPKVLDALKEREVRNGELAIGRDDLKKQADDGQKMLEAEKTKLGLMPDTADKIVAVKAFREKKLRLEFEIDYAEKLLAERQAEALRELCNKIQFACGELAQLRGYHLVLSTDAGVPLQGNADEITRTVSLKRVVYSSPDIDVSDELVQFMNNKYAAAPTPAPTPAPAPTKKP